MRYCLPAVCIALLLLYYGCVQSTDPGGDDHDAGEWCGNGALEPGEECDLGWLNSDEEPGGCRTDCRWQLCGNTELDPGELCDDGDLEDGDGCPADCGVSMVSCGDGLVDPDTGEECDDGNQDNWDGCTLTCREAEIRVNSDRLEMHQRLQQVAASPDGRFVVVWIESEESGIFDDLTPVWARRFDASGRPLGPTFQVTPDGGPYQVLMDETGAFTVYWQRCVDRTLGANVWEIGRQRYSSEGAALGEAELITRCEDCIIIPDLYLSAVPDGRHVLSWYRQGPTFMDTLTRVQHFSADGTPDGSRLEMEIYSGVRTAIADDGSWALVWWDMNDRGSHFWIQRYHPDNTTDGEPILVQNQSVIYVWYIDFALSSDGRLMVLWNELPLGGSRGKDDQCLYQVFDASNAPLTEPTKCFSSADSQEVGRDLAVASDGSFVLAWELRDDVESPDQTYLRPGLYVQRYDRDGVAVSTPLRMHVYDVFPIPGPRLNRFFEPRIALGEDRRCIASFYACYDCNEGEEGHSYPPDVQWGVDVYARILFP